MPRRKRKEEDINNLSIKEWIIKELGLKWIFIFIFSEITFVILFSRPILSIPVKSIETVLSRES